MAKSSSPAPANNRLVFLDAVRGIAALLVVFEHYFSKFPGGFLEQASPWMNLGRVGVTAFFLVSGFVIPMSIERSGDLKSFWIGRVFRLYPAYLLSLLIIGGLALVVPEALGRSGAIAGQLPQTPWPWIANASLFQMFLGVKDINPVAWTLGLEWIIYGVCAYMFWRGSLKQTDHNTILTIAIMTLVGVVLPLMLHKRVPAPFVILMISAQLGLVAFRKAKDNFDSGRALVYTAVGILVAFVASYVNYQLLPKTGKDEVILTWQCVAISTTLGYILFFGGSRLFATNAPKALTWLGRVSYSLYLTHAAWLVLPEIVSPVVTAFIRIGCALVTAELAYRFIEDPMIQLGKRMVKKYKTQASPNPEAVVKLA